MKNKIKLFVVLFLIGFLSSCENEPYDNRGALIYKNSELHEMLDKVIENSFEISCVDFIYPFILNVYGTDENLIEELIVSGDAVFSQILGNLTEGQSISLSYPITNISENGTIFEINSNAQLKESIDACYQDCIIGECEYIFSDVGEQPFVWRIIYQENQENQFSSGYIDASYLGELNMFYNNTNNQGNWVFLFIENTLYLNINLHTDVQISQYWNYNFEVLHYSYDFIILKHPTNNKSIKIVRVNETTLDFELGDIGDKGGIVFFDKGDYTEGWRYMEVKTTNLQNIEWGCINGLISSNYTEIGKGFYNSCLIANYHDQLDNYYSNPTICSQENNGTVASRNVLTFTSENTWFLPSQEELTKVYQNLYLQNLIIIDSGVYWTSTQTNISDAIAIDFHSGDVLELPKNTNNNKILVVRYF